MRRGSPIIDFVSPEPPFSSAHLSPVGRQEERGDPPVDLHVHIQMLIPHHLLSTPRPRSLLKIPELLVCPRGLPGCCLPPLHPNRRTPHPSVNSLSSLLTLQTGGRPWRRLREKLKKLPSLSRGSGPWRNRPLFLHDPSHRLVKKKGFQADELITGLLRPAS